MSRLSAEITEIPGKRITVKELTVKEIREFWNKTGEVAFNGIEALSSYLTAFLPTCIDGLKPEDFDEMTPSEIKIIYDKFIEVNQVFFDLAQIAEGGNPMLVDLRLSLTSDLIMRYAALSRKGIPAPSDTATASSST